MTSGLFFFGAVSNHIKVSANTRYRRCSLIIALRNDNIWSGGGNQLHQCWTKTEQKEALFSKERNKEKILYTYSVFHTLEIQY